VTNELPRKFPRVHRPAQKLVLRGSDADVAFDVMLEYLQATPAYAGASYHTLATAFGDLRDDLHELLD
jgi:hypothetical protein